MWSSGLVSGSWGCGPAWWLRRRQVTVTSPSDPRQQEARAAGSAEDRPLDRVELGLARHDRARLLERGLRVLQAVAGEHADDARARRRRRA